METCVVSYKSRGWSKQNSCSVVAEIKDASGEVKILLKGQYTGKIIATDLQTQESWTLFEAPSDIFPENYKKQYCMNNFALQLNLLPEKLMKKLPPTDSRLRPDIRAWENGEADLATKEKERLEKI